MALGRRKVTSVDLNRESPTATEEYICGWTEAFTIGMLMVGGWQSVFGTPIYLPPASFTEIPGLRASSFKITPIYNGDQEIEGAKVTVEYGILKNDDDDGNPEDVAEVSVSVGVEAFTIPKPDESKIYTWSSGSKSGEKVDSAAVMPHKLLPLVEINVDFKFKPNFPLDTWVDKVGHVNSSTFTIRGKSFTSEKLLFIGATDKEAMTTDGTKGHGRGLKFAAKKDGWNKVYDPKLNQFNTVTPNLYSTTSFSTLFND